MLDSISASCVRITTESIRVVNDHIEAYLPHVISTDYMMDVDTGTVTLSNKVFV